MIVRELLTRLGFTVDEAGAQKYERRLDGVRAAAGRVQAAFGGVVAQLGAAFGVQKVLNYAETWQNLEAQLDSVSRATGQQTKTLHELKEAANGARVSVEAYTDSYVGLMRTGLSSQDAFDLAGIIGQTGSSTSALYQFNQAMGSGILQGDELRSIFEDTGILAEGLAQGLGTDIAGLKKMAKAGKLTAKVVMDGLKKAEPWIVKNRSSVLKLSDAWTILNNNMMETAGGSDQARWGIRALTNTVMWLAEHTNVLAGAFAVFTAGAGLAFAAWVGEAIVSLTKLGKALAVFAMTPQGFLILTALAAIALALQDIYTWINGGDALLGRWLGKWEDFRPKAEAALAGAREALGELKAAMDALMQGEFFKAWNLFQNADKAFTIALGFTPEDVSKVFNDALMSIFRAGWQGFTSALGDAFNVGGDTLVAKLGAFFSALNPANWFKMEDTGLLPWLGKKVGQARDWALSPFEEGGVAGPITGNDFPPVQGGSPMSMTVPKGLDALSPSSYGGGLRYPSRGGQPAVNNVSLQLGDINVQAPPGADAREHGAIVAAEIERVFDRRFRDVIDGALSSFPETA